MRDSSLRVTRRGDPVTSNRLMEPSPSFHAQGSLYSARREKIGDLQIPLSLVRGPCGIEGDSLWSRVEPIVGKRLWSERQQPMEMNLKKRRWVQQRRRKQLAPI